MSVTSRLVLLARARSFLMEALGLPSRNVNLALNYGSRAEFTLQPHVEFVGKRCDLNRSCSSITALLVALGALAAPAAAQDRSASPEAATGSRAGQVATAKSFMISAANPLAVEAGLEILRAGGSAADAAIAVQLVLNLVEPQSSGLGGGAFILHWDAAAECSKATTAGKRRRPRRHRTGSWSTAVPRKFDEAVFGGLSVGVPGTLRVLEAVHKRHGRLPWASLFAPAIRSPRRVFGSPRACICCCAGRGLTALRRAARRYFFDRTGSAWPVGYLAPRTPVRGDFACIAEGGADASTRAPSPRRSSMPCARLPTTRATSRRPISPATA